MSQCSELKSGEILNAEKGEAPLYRATLYGSSLACAKFSKRLSCALKSLAIRIEFRVEYDIQKAVEMGIQKDPTLVLEDKIFIESLVQAEDITERFKSLVEA